MIAIKQCRDIRPVRYAQSHAAGPAVYAACVLVLCRTSCELRQTSDADGRYSLDWHKSSFNSSFCHYPEPARMNTLRGTREIKLHGSARVKASDLIGILRSFPVTLFEIVFFDFRVD